LLVLVLIFAICLGAGNYDLILENVTDCLRRHGTATKQIIFEGEPSTALNGIELSEEVL